MEWLESTHRLKVTYCRTVSGERAFFTTGESHFIACQQKTLLAFCVDKNNSLKFKLNFVLNQINKTKYWVVLCQDKKVKLTLYKRPKSAQCASTVEEKWRHVFVHHAGSSWVTRSVDRSGRSDEQNSHRERRRDGCTVHLMTDTDPLWRRVHIHTYSHIKFDAFIISALISFSNNECIIHM